MKPITKALSEWTELYFNNNDIEVSEDGERATYRFTGSNKGDFEYRGFVEAYENRPGVMVFLYAPFKVPQRYRKDVAEVLVMSNYSLVNGAICMDMRDGEIRYKTGVDVKDGKLSVAMINELVDRGSAILDQYLPAVAGVIYAGQTAESAFAKAEGSNEAMSQKNESADIVEEDEIKPWETFEGCDQVRAWAEDLQNTLPGKGDMQAWELAGRAAVIVNEDKNYCREILRRVAADNNMKFTTIAACDVMDMSPSTGLKDIAPALVYLEPGRWMQTKGNSDESEKVADDVRQFQSKLSNFLRSFDPKHPIVYVVSASRPDDVASRLRKVGLFERFIALPQERLETAAENFLAQIGKEYCSEALLNSLGKLGKLLKTEVDNADQRKLAALCLRRLYLREKRQLEFVDIVHIISHSLQEEGRLKNDTEELRQHNAIHEAGHAVMAVLDSGGKNVPEYASIVPSVGFSGIVIESYAFHYAHDAINTYQDFRHNIRISLAGRAAEEVFFGVDGISTGSSGDLETASRYASKAFAYWGFAPQMEKGERSGVNLGVIFGKPSQSEMKHVEALVRQFFEEEYEIVKTTLEQNRPLLDAVAERLMADPILDQEELSAIFSDNSHCLIEYRQAGISIPQDSRMRDIA